MDVTSTSRAKTAPTARVCLLVVIGLCCLGFTGCGAEGLGGQLLGALAPGADTGCTGPDCSETTADNNPMDATTAGGEAPATDEQTSDPPPDDSEPDDQAEPEDRATPTEDESDDSSAPPPGDVSAGGSLYRLNCLECHGPDGDGGSAPGIRGATTSQITAAITGRNGHTRFDGLTGLTGEDVENIAAFLASP
ncbi:MAG: cytochrome c [Phycisphaerales bacterium]|nr:MAG: cytochrome c [Phycisphaerales bacterium]